MNVVNMNKAIAIMERAQLVHLAFWQKVDSEAEVVTTEEDLQERGIAACFAGHVAVSPEFQADGGTVGPSGYPILGAYNGSEAIAQWLGITFDQADGLSGFSNFNEMYGSIFRQDVTPQDVVDRLIRLRDTGV